MNKEHAQYAAQFLSESRDVMNEFAQNPEYAETLAEISETVVQALKNGRKLMIAGNGGSAADAQHIAGEFVSRLMFDRAPLPALALTTDSTALTAIGNDYGYQYVFDRQLRALGQEGDVFLGISTSGKSPNVLCAFESARSKGITTIGFTGSQEAGSFQQLCDFLVAAPSTKTAFIQQVHIVAAHIICACVERAMFPDKAK